MGAIQKASLLIILLLKTPRIYLSSAASELSEIVFVSVHHFMLCVVRMIAQIGVQI